MERDDSCDLNFFGIENHWSMFTNFRHLYEEQKAILQMYPIGNKSFKHEKLRLDSVNQETVTLEIFKTDV